ncbi:MAG: GntR family transcriptional regulator [Methylococcales bacterium]
MDVKIGSALGNSQKGKNTACGDNGGPDRDTDEGRQNSSFLYKTVYELLNTKISSGVLPAGSVLKEGSIATQLEVSRPPVRRALEMLSKDGAIRDTEGQGYVIGNAAPVTLSARVLHDILVGGHNAMDRTVLWQRIIEDVQAHIEACIAFSHYRIMEAELGEFHNVSRTVVREVLWRLRDRRLVEKDRKSHWIVSQLSARDVQDSFEMRQVLEPRAMLAVAARLDRNWLDALLVRVNALLAQFPACQKQEIDRLEHDMFHTMFVPLRNMRMLNAIRRNQTCLLVSRLFRRHFPLRDEQAVLLDYAQILHHLREGTPDIASVLLEHHLKRSQSVMKARLRVLSVIPLPRTPPYLRAVYHKEAGFD